MYDSRSFNETTKSEESNGVEVIPIHNDESLEDTLKQSEGESNLGTDKARIYELMSVISCVTDPLKKHKNFTSKPSSKQITKENLDF